MRDGKKSGEKAYKGKQRASVLDSARVLGLQELHSLLSLYFKFSLDIQAPTTPPCAPDHAPVFNFLVLIKPSRFPSAPVSHILSSYGAALYCKRNPFTLPVLKIRLPLATMPLGLWSCFWSPLVFPSLAFTTTTIARRALKVQPAMVLMVLVVNTNWPKMVYRIMVVRTRE